MVAYCLVPIQFPVSGNRLIIRNVD